MNNTTVEDLLHGAGELARTAEGRPEGAGAAAVAARLREGRFSISIVGEFKRGKSTLVNALVGEAVVPTGVLPLTAVRTELAFGSASTVVEHRDGTRRDIARADVPFYVAEELNPGNRKQIARVLLTGEWDLLAGGVVLVDTPGVGSIHEHNSTEARAALLDTDGAIVVLAADAPLSARELEMLHILGERQAPTFFVLNKVDHLDTDELAQVRCFVNQAVEDHLGRPRRIFEVDARAALAGRRRGGGHGPAGFDFDELLGQLCHFVRHDLSGAMIGGATRDLAELGRSLLDALTVEQAALEIDSAGLVRLAREFQRAAAEQHQMFEDDQTLLRRDVAGLARSGRARLDDFARNEPARYFDVLEETAASAPVGLLTDELWDTIQTSVRASFEKFRPSESARTDHEWHAIADAFRRRTEQRVAAVREAASELFNIELPRLEIPAVSAERERFFYLFIHVGSSTDLFGSLVRRFVPAPFARRRAVRQARAELAREFAKHAGRAGWDLAQRLEAACGALERTMDAELHRCTQAIIGAAERADRRRRDIEQLRDAKAGETAKQWQLAQALADLSRSG